MNYKKVLSSYCRGESISFNPGSFASYKWQDNSALSDFIASQTGVYWVKVTDDNNCTANDTVRILSISPVPSNFLKNADSICQYDVLVISANTNYQSYSWSTGSSGSSITIEKPGHYILTATDLNMCSGKDSILVIQKDCYTGVFIPTAFTPNGDNVNDIFKSKIYGKVLSFSFMVYDRWGHLIFNTSDPFKGWDGNSKKGQAEAGTFVWKCIYHLQGYEPASKKGVVTLIR